MRVVMIGLVVMFGVVGCGERNDNLLRECVESAERVEEAMTALAEFHEPESLENILIRCELEVG